MKIGVCCALDRLPLLQKIGADFMETNMTLISRMDESAFESALRTVQAAPGFVQTANCMFPGDEIHLTGPLYDEEKMVAYATKLFDRMDRLNCHTLVFGSSAAKNLPDGYDTHKGYRELVHSLSILSELAAQYGHTLLVEPLNPKECNLILSTEEACQLVKDVHQSNLFAMVDFYHLCQNGEYYSTIQKNIELIRHVHIASPVMRILPRPFDGADYAGFIRYLSDCGYDGRISIESREAGTEETLKDTLLFLKSK